MKSTLVHDKEIIWAKRNTRLPRFSSMSGKMNEEPEANVKWNDQLQDFGQSNAYRELFGIDGEPLEFE